MQLETWYVHMGKYVKNTNEYIIKTVGPVPSVQDAFEIKSDYQKELHYDFFEVNQNPILKLPNLV